MWRFLVITHEWKPEISPLFGCIVGLLNHKMLSFQLSFTTEERLEEIDCEHLLRKYAVCDEEALDEISRIHLYSVL